MISLPIIMEGGIGGWQKPKNRNKMRQKLQKTVSKIIENWNHNVCVVL